MKPSPSTNMWAHGRETACMSVWRITCGPITIGISVQCHFSVFPFYKCRGMIDTFAVSGTGVGRATLAYSRWQSEQNTQEHIQHLPEASGHKNLVRLWEWDRRSMYVFVCAPVHVHVCEKGRGQPGLSFLNHRPLCLVWLCFRSGVSHWPGTC